jgi:hypothetical protein
MAISVSNISAVGAIGVTNTNTERAIVVRNTSTGTVRATVVRIVA